MLISNYINKEEYVCLLGLEAFTQQGHPNTSFFRGQGVRLLLCLTAKPRRICVCLLNCSKSRVQNPSCPWRLLSKHRWSLLSNPSASYSPVGLETHPFHENMLCYLCLDQDAPECDGVTPGSLTEPISNDAVAGRSFLGHISLLQLVTWGIK